MLFLNIFVTVVTAVIVNGFKKRIISPQYLVLSTFNSAARELDRPLEILKEISAECSARDLNILATKLISRCSAHSYLRKCDDIYEYVRSVSEPDSRLQTTLMSAYISHRKFREALILFDEMREKDKVAYTNAVRAAEHTSFTRVEELLHKALADLGPTSSTQVFNAALANMKFLDRNTTENSAPVEGVLIPEVNSYVIVDRARKLLDWMVQSKITVSSQTMDTYLNVVCAHGNEKLVEDAILLRQQFNLAASDYTLNIVMAYYLSSNKPFNEVIFLLRSLIMKWNVQPDAVTVNTLLKNCVSTKNLKDIDQVLALMTEWDIQPNRWTNELLLEIDGLRGNADSAFRLVENMSDSELTPHMISSALNLCDNSTSVLRLTKRALALGVADSTVVVTAVKKLVATGEFENAHHVLRSLWQQGTQLDKYVLSSMLSAVFLECRTLLEGKQIVATGEPIQGRVVLLRQYLQTVKISQPYLLTSSICQRVVRELIELGDCDAACSIHLQLFPRCTVQTELLTALFQGLQDSCTTAASSNDSEYALNLAKKGLALFHIYAFSNSTSLKNDGSFEDHKVYPLSLLRSIHVNNVFKLLSTAKLYDFSEKLFHILSHHQFVEQVEPSVSRLRLGRTLLPTVFTIAELVRTGRASGRVALTRNAILWGIESETYLPLDLVRDAMSLIYAKGEVGMVRTLYDRLYRAGRVNHWVDAKGAALEEPVVDLHYFSRGMAYAAINCAIREMRENRALNRSSRFGSSVTLTIITGRNLPNTHSSSEGRPSTAITESDESDAYRLSNEIQNVLIDDFFPPISSSTVPGNPGRLYITLSL